MREVELFYGSDPEMCVGVKAFDGQSAADNRRLIALAPEMREMLLKLEWELHRTNGVIGTCPKCDGYEEVGYGDGGHRPGCTLAALLEKLR